MQLREKARRLKNRVEDGGSAHAVRVESGGEEWVWEDVCEEACVGR